MASLVFENAIKLMAQGLLDWDDAGVTYRAMLLTSGYTPDANDVFVADLSNEVSDASYARVAVGTRSVNLAAGSAVQLIAGTTTFPNLDVVTPKYVAVFKLVTNDADSPVVAVIDTGNVTAANGSDCVIFWGATNPTGIVAQIPFA